MEELLLPILYIETEELSSDNTDEAIALVAKTQYVDWHNFRLAESSSREYRTAVNNLARRLLEIGRKVAESQLEHELCPHSEEDDIKGITDLMADIMSMLPEWLEVVMTEKLNDAQMNAVTSATSRQLAKLQRAHAPASALFAVQTRWAREVLPLVERALEDARVYLSQSIKLDPLVSALARLVSDYPESFPLVMPVREAIDEAVEEIRKNELKKKDPHHTFMRDDFSRMRHLGRIFQKGYSIINQKDHAVDEGNEIVSRWDTELRVPNKGSRSDAATPEK